MTIDYSKLSVIIPTLNEEANIGVLLEVLIQLYPNIYVIVADDGSKDQTQLIVKSYNQKYSNVRLLDRSQAPIHGLTASVVDAIKVIPTPYFIVIDGDFQHPPNKIKDLFNQLREENVIVIGIRVSVPDWKFSRRLLSWGATFLGRIALFMRHAASSSDIMSGFFAARSQIIQQIMHKYPDKFQLKGYKVLFDILKLIPKGTNIGEVPYTFDNRRGGESKIGKKHIFEYLMSIFR